MGKINLSINDNTEADFRDAAGRMYGAKKGVLAEAAEEAFRDWVKKVNATGADLKAGKVPRRGSE
jgi:hypothetical protein